MYAYNQHPAIDADLVRAPRPHTTFIYYAYISMYIDDLYSHPPMILRHPLRYRTIL